MSDDDSEDLHDQLTSIGMKTPPRRRWPTTVRLWQRTRVILLAVYRVLPFLYGRVTWYLWDKRALLARVEQQKDRMKQLAGLNMPTSPPPPRPYSEVDRLADHRHYLDRNPGSEATNYEKHVEAIKKTPYYVPPPPPPGPPVTDRVAVDYQVILGKPYLVSDVTGKPVPVEVVRGPEVGFGFVPTVVPKRKRKRAPTGTTKKKRSRGKPAR